MYELPLDEIVTMISKKTGTDRTTITLKIQEKVQELSGLISMEGAAHVVANEMGIELLNTSEKFMKIKEFRELLLLKIHFLQNKNYFFHNQII